MEETLEKKVALEEKVHEDDQGGIRHRLRDRDLLKKRKAEAEARVTRQDESRKRAKREPNSTLKKKGRPRKNIIVEQEPENSEIQEHKTPEEPTSVPSLISVSVPAITSFPDLISPPDSVPALPAAQGLISSPASVSAAALTPSLISPPVSFSVPFSVSAPISDPGSILVPGAVSVSALSPAPILDSNSAPISATVAIPEQVSASGLNLSQIPDVVSTPTFPSAPEATQEIKLSTQSPQGVLIEDLDPDEDDDKARPQDKLGINQGGVELSPGVAGQNKGFLDSVFVSSQHDS